MVRTGAYPLKPPKVSLSEVFIGHLQPGMIGEWQGVMGALAPAAGNHPAVDSSNSSKARPRSGVPPFLPWAPPSGPKPPCKAAHEAPSSWPPVFSSVTEPRHLAGESPDPSFFGGPTSSSAKCEQVGQKRGSFTLPSPGPSLAGKQGRGEDRWEDGRWHLRDQHPEKQEAGVGRGLCFRGTCFGSFAELAPPQVSRAACQITTGGLWESGGGEGRRESGQTGTYTTDVCSEKYSKIVMQI